MKYAIIGSGNVGTAIARQFARSGIVVAIANTRGPDSIASLAQELGNNVSPVTLHAAIEADVVILAVPQGLDRRDNCYRPTADIALRASSGQNHSFEMASVAAVALRKKWSTRNSTLRGTCCCIRPLTPLTEGRR